MSAYAQFEESARVRVLSTLKVLMSTSTFEYDLHLDPVVWCPELVDDTNECQYILAELGPSTFKVLEYEYWVLQKYSSKSTSTLALFTKVLEYEYRVLKMYSWIL